MLASTTQFNWVGSVLAALDSVHAVTAVTGFGLLGHLLEVCRGSGLRAVVQARDVSLLPGTGQRRHGDGPA